MQDTRVRLQLVRPQGSTSPRQKQQQPKRLTTKQLSAKMIHKVKYTGRSARTAMGLSLNSLTNTVQISRKTIKTKSAQIQMQIESEKWWTNEIFGINGQGSIRTLARCYKGDIIIDARTQYQHRWNTSNIEYDKKGSRLQVLTRQIRASQEIWLYVSHRENNIWQ